MVNTFTVSRTISDQQLSKIIQIESGGRPRAKAPTSSATGLFQFIDTTWMSMVEKYKPEWLRGRSRQQVLDLRFDPVKSIEMGARFTEENARGIGPGWQEGDLYLAHFLGLATARRVFRASSTSPVEPLAGGAAVRANRSILAGKTCGQVRAWAERKMRISGETNWIERFNARGLPMSHELPPPAARSAEEADSAEAHDAPGDEGALDESETAGAHGDPVDETDFDEHAAPVLTDLEIKAAQEALKGMGFYEVGMVDGKWGSRTVAAVSAFQTERGLPVNGELDEVTKIEIEEALAETDPATGKRWRRPIAPERAQGKPQNSKIVEGSEKGIITAIFAAISGWLTQFGEYMPWINDIADSPLVKPFRVLVAQNFGLILLILAGGALWYFFKIRKARIEGFRKGELS